MNTLEGLHGKKVIKIAVIIPVTFLCWFKYIMYLKITKEEKRLKMK